MVDTESFISGLFGKAGTIAVVCNQWGDTGKGKFVDLLSEEAEVILRGTGGANAGHTIVKGLVKIVTHIIPSGILHQGKLNIIGRGTAIDLFGMMAELDSLKKVGIQVNNMLIDGGAKLVLPWHRFMDAFSTTSKAIGTTGRGIGYCYGDYYLRIGLTVNDLYSPNFRQTLADNYAYHMPKLLSLYKELDLAKVHTFFASTPDYFDTENLYDVAKVAEDLEILAEQLTGLICDSQKLVSGKKVLLEGAQGLLLNIDHGTTKNQTSSDTSVFGLAKGSGLLPSQVGLTLGVVKAFMTRVGSGPFPTEMGGRRSEEYCKATTKDQEKAKGTGQLDMSDELQLGAFIRIKGDEYGATTGRLRRTGWLDLVALKYALKVNGPNIVITKLDLLSAVKEIKVCTSYIYNGKERLYNGLMLKPGQQVDYFIPESEILYDCTPLYRTFTGWRADISGAREKKQLPAEALSLLDFIEQFTGARIIFVSVSPDREANVIYHEDFK